MRMLWGLFIILSKINQSIKKSRLHKEPTFNFEAPDNTNQDIDA
jgi:hypothetical protein